MKEMLPWFVSLFVWECYHAGEVTEFSASIAEYGTDYSGRTWDRGTADLEACELWDGTERKPTPWWWALPWVSEQVMRREMAT